MIKICFSYGFWCVLNESDLQNHDELLIPVIIMGFLVGKHQKMSIL